MTAAAPRSDAAASPSGAAAAPRSDAAAPQPHPGPWAGVRVVDFSGLAGAYGTRVWAALGAEVIAVEPPDGNLLRTIPPLHPELTGPEAGLWWAYYGAGKASVVLDPDDPHDAATLAELAASADVVVDDSPPALQDRPGWGRADSQRRNPALTWVSVTPFGMTGPHRDWAGSDLIAWAACGLASTVGFPDRPPLAPAAQVQLLMHVASMDVVLGAMLALRGRDRGAPGQRIDVSLQEVGLSIAPETGVPLYLDDQAERP
ncbi:MAG TPA: hypothetical protein DEP69_06240, partial [Acidimicrobiaceae bacterium]|nr:hypothetical protein [Acidimicrobiaceae bacterium]